MTTPKTATSFEDRVGQVLVEGGFINRLQLTQAQKASQLLGTALLDTLVFSGALAQETLVTVLIFQLRIPVVDLRHAHPDPEVVRLIPEWYARQNAVLPLGFDADGSLRIATKMPNDFQLSAELSAIAGRQIKFVLAIGGRIDEAIRRIYATYTAGLIRAEKAALHKVAPPTFLHPDVTDLPAVWVTEMVIGQATRSGTSEIHMVPDAESARVLFRMGGVLQRMAMLQLVLHQSIVSHIKVLASMDIAETVRPQEGTFTMTLGERKVEFQVSSVGNTFGERMVVCILDQSHLP